MYTRQNGDEYKPPQGWARADTQCRDGNQGDDSMLVFRSTHWVQLTNPAKNCMDKWIGNSGYEHSRRPYTLEAFQNRYSGFQLLVLAAHFPHSDQFAMLPAHVQ